MSKHTNLSNAGTQAPLPVQFSQGDAEFLHTFDQHLLGDHVTRVSMGGNMETIKALVGLYGDVTVLQVHYHLMMNSSTRF